MHSSFSICIALSKYSAEHIVDQNVDNDIVNGYHMTVADSENDRSVVESVEGRSQNES